MRIRDLLEPKAVDLSPEVKDKEGAINRLVDLISSTGCINDAERFRQAVFDREAKGSTGLGEGVAIPHAKSAGVSYPGLAAMVVRDGIEFDSLDGKKARLFFIIASPHKASDAHLDVLARLSSLLIDPSFRQSLIDAKSVSEFLSLIDKAESAEKDEEQSHEAAPPSEGSYDLVAVTACPAGLSHTYMAAEALELKAREMGLSIKVEADGAAGNRNKLLPEDIAKAKAVIVAADRTVRMDRFIGKPLVRVGVNDGIRKPEELITRALSPDCPKYSLVSSTESVSLPMLLYRHLMSGLTYLMPLVAASGLLSAFAALDHVNGTDVGFFFETVGYSISILLFPVLSAFIALSIGGRTALVAGFVGGVMADLSGAGVIGAVLNGFAGGAIAYMTAKLARSFLRGHDAMFALLVYPLAGTLGVTAVAEFVTSIPSSALDSWIMDFINQSSPASRALLGAVLASMMSADMGGPLNKLSYAIGVLMLADSLPESGAGGLVMAAVMAGGMVPPLAAGLASLCARPLFSANERKQSLGAIGKGLLFVTEGVMPFMLIAPSRMRFACFAGSACAGALSCWWGCAVCAPHGGIFIIPLAYHALNYASAVGAGTLTGAVLMVLLRIGVKMAR
ncbi:MAG: fructose-specific PTS transporter subunit EIIC [Aeromonadales bacterium]|nr:fructose-specific PTS transporter subunit EIIC [Aeromonadales bacterium]MDY2891394.1 fructose-specific PTS transporter subunit EIIC [Succinivibrio sp.]